MNNLLATLKQLGATRLAIMGGVVAAMLGFFIFVSAHISSPGMKLLYDNLSTTDSAAMASKLEEAKIHYDVSPDATRINVAADQIGQARMLLAKNGLPNGGTMGYELFDQQSGFGTTNFVQNINQVRALEGELARTISSVQAVKSTRVHLVLPERELFSRESHPSSASVFLSLKPGMTLDRGQIGAIQSLVSSAVPQLKAQSVSVIDSNGNLLARGGDDDDSIMSGKAEEMQHQYEQRLTQQVEDLVGRVVGYGHVHATVAATLNFDRISTNEEAYDPNGQVARSTQTVKDNSSEKTASGAGDVSVQNNLPGIASTSDASSPTSESGRTEETTNYEISKTVRNSVSEVGNVKKQSIAVLVDGTYTTGKDGKKTYAPRSQAELDKISALVKSAAGFDDKRGDTIDVANLQFADVDAGDAKADSSLLMGFERSELLNAAEIITVSIMVVLAMLLVLKPMVGSLLSPGGNGGGDDARRVMPELLPGRPAAPALTGPSPSGSGSIASSMPEEDETLIDMSRVEGKVKASSIKKVEDIVGNYPTETVSVIRSWMGQET